MNGDIDHLGIGAARLAQGPRLHPAVARTPDVAMLRRRLGAPGQAPFTAPSI